MERTVVTLKPHRARGSHREPGETYTADPNLARHLSRNGFVRVCPWDLDWHQLPRRVLRQPEVERVARPVVACLNIWDDRPALEQTAPTWWKHVSAVVIADGSYQTTGKASRSADGLKDCVGQLAAEHETAVQWVPIPKGGWPDQVTKRTALLQHAAKAYPDAWLFVVDADEFVTGSQVFGEPLPDAEVGWVSVTSPLYERPAGQPRLIRAMPGLAYDGRHHWLTRDGVPLASHQEGGFAKHAVIDVRLHNQRGLGHTSERRQAKRRHQQAQASREHATVRHPRDQMVGARETLRIVQLGRIDAGLVAFRLHTAINATTPHASALVLGADSNPFGGPSQYRWPHDRDQAESLVELADVAHCHLGYEPFDRMPAKPKRLVIHHHGTLYRTGSEAWALYDHAHKAGLRLVSNTELLQYDTDLRFLPNPVPVAWYRSLTNRSTTGPFRIAHSPSKRAIKGTDVFLRVCERLQGEGLDIEPVLIEGASHAEAIQAKATCHAAFDSFDLGMQCSGIEAAAMGVPVIAGDVDCRREYAAWLGQVPYTWANDEQGLAEALARLVTDQDFYDAEAKRVTDYVETHHDEAAVATRYLDLLDEAFQWRGALALTNRAPRPEAPGSRNPRTTTAPPPRHIAAPTPEAA